MRLFPIRKLSTWKSFTQNTWARGPGLNVSGTCETDAQMETLCGDVRKGKHINSCKSASPLSDRLPIRSRQAWNRERHLDLLRFDVRLRQVWRAQHREIKAWVSSLRPLVIMTFYGWGRVIFLLIVRKAVKNDAERTHSLWNNLHLDKTFIPPFSAQESNAVRMPGDLLRSARFRSLCRFSLGINTVEVDQVPKRWIELWLLMILWWMHRMN